MNELSQWLQDALERLEYWSTQAMVVPQDPEMVRDHLYTFLVRHRDKLTPSQLCFNKGSGLAHVASIC